LPLLILAAYMVACNKTPDPNPSRASILRTGKWKISAASVQLKLPGGSDTTIDYLGLIPSCRLDDYLQFDSLSQGYVFSNTEKCSVGDADSIGFVWQLSNNDNNLSIFNGFTLLDSVVESALPYHIDTLQSTPTLVLDTLATTPNVVLDSMYTVQFSASKTASINITNAAITDFSSSSFTMSFSLISQYPHMDYFISAPVYKPDTLHFKVTYANF